MKKPFLKTSVYLISHEIKRLSLLYNSDRIKLLFDLNNQEWLPIFYKNNYIVPKISGTREIFDIELDHKQQVNFYSDLILEKIILKEIKENICL